MEGQTVGAVRTERGAPATDAQMELIKEATKKVADLIDLFEKVRTPGQQNEKARCAALAQTNLEQALMWGVKAITRS